MCIKLESVEVIGISFDGTIFNYSEIVIFDIVNCICIMHINSSFIILTYNISTEKQVVEGQDRIARVWPHQGKVQPCIQFTRCYLHAHRIMIEGNPKCKPRKHC